MPYRDQLWNYNNYEIIETNCSLCEITEQLWLVMLVFIMSSYCAILYAASCCDRYMEFILPNVFHLASCLILSCCLTLCRVLLRLDCIVRVALPSRCCRGPINCIYLFMWRCLYTGRSVVDNWVCFWSALWLS